MASIEQRVRAIEKMQGTKEAILPPVVRVIYPGDTEPDSGSQTQAGRRVVTVRFVPPGDGDINRNPFEEAKA
jgi:hypothetical protein